MIFFSNTWKQRWIIQNQFHIKKVAYTKKLILFSYVEEKYRSNITIFWTANITCTFREVGFFCSKNNVRQYLIFWKHLSNFLWSRLFSQFKIQSSPQQKYSDSNLIIVCLQRFPNENFQNREPITYSDQN